MSCRISGQETTEFYLALTDPENAFVDGTIDWYIQDTELDGTDNSTNLSDQELAYRPQKQFHSPGQKLIQINLTGDDGWGNLYDYEEEIVVEVTRYDVPVIDFDWIPNEPTINDLVTFNQNNLDTRNDEDNTYYGRIDKVDIDIFNDGELEYKELSDTDQFTYQFTIKQDNIPIKQIVTWWDGFEYQVTELIKYLDMSNIPPVPNWDRIDKGRCTPAYTWVATSTDEDDDDSLLTHKWELYFYNQDTSTYELIDSATGNEYNYPFQYEGLYMIKLISTDPEGSSSIKDEEFSIEFGACSSDGTKEVIIKPKTIFVEW
jgi:hypothetical protein